MLGKIGEIKTPTIRSDSASANSTWSSASERLESFASFHGALERIGEFVTACNTYIEMAAPWKLAKDPERAEALDHALFAVTESLRIIAVLVSPMLPHSAGQILYQLNWTGAYTMADTKWGGLPDKHHLGKPTPLFPRIETGE